MLFRSADAQGAGEHDLRRGAEAGVEALVGTASFLLRAIVDADESFRTGLSAATQIMFARALRIRLRHVPPTGIHRHMQ